MKKIFLFVLFVSLFCLAGCGDDKNIYDDNDSPKQDSDSKNDDDAATHPNDDSGKNDDDTVVPDSGQDNTENNNDSDDTENDSDPGDTENNNDSDGQNDKQPDDFWRTCEGIIACSKNCASEDMNCFSSCYGKGYDEEQSYYRAWRDCFDENCAEDQTAECSAEHCAEWDALCNVAEAFEYELKIPAPYGNASFAGQFSYILKHVPNVNTPENQIIMDGFVQGTISNTMITPAAGTIVSFARMFSDPAKGEMVEVVQVPYNIVSQVPGNPAVLLRMKTGSATKGTRTVGVTEESDAEFIVVDIDAKYNIMCYHAFGIGTFSIDEAIMEAGSSGKFNFSEGSVELFYPQNIPELGGDAREILGVKACSLID
ncbi:hypothetical protein J6Z19_01940 [bacterium]|nr:hypothetical protein [bacterium]